MKKNEVKMGAVYTAKVSDRLVPVRIDSENPKGGWDATNLATNKKIRIKSAQRLRAKVKAPKSAKGAATTPSGASPKPDPAKAKKNATRAKRGRQGGKSAGAGKRVSALDAAARVLRSAGQPMGCRDLIAAMAEQGLWTSPAGKTPHATLYAAMLREIQKAIEAGRGQFAFNKEAVK